MKFRITTERFVLFQVEGQPSDKTDPMDISGSSANLLSREAVMTFPKGLVGFSHLRQFRVGVENGIVVLTPDEAPELRFNALPLDLSQSLLEAEDVLQAQEALHINPEELLILVLISGKKEEDALIITANLRAPLFIDVFKKEAWQYVFAHNRYPIKYEIGRVTN